MFTKRIVEGRLRANMSDEDNSNNEPMQGLYLFTFLVGFVVLVWTMMNY